MAPKARPGILKIHPYVGGESALPGVNRVSRLASNENPLGPSDKAVVAYQAVGGELHRYPDGGASDLRAAIAEIHGLEPERIVCGAGSDELIQLLARAYAGPGDEVLYSAHGFLLYPITARAVGATPVAAPERNLTADLDGLLARVTPDTRVVFLANPNNPTGTYLPEAELRRLQKALPDDVLLVLDAAYAEYVEAPAYDAGAALAAEFDNVVMTRTFSKIHGLAALRLGWAYCPPGVAAVLNRLRGPFNVSAPALAAGLAAIRDQDHVARSLDHNRRWRDWLAAELESLGLTVAPSVANFLLVRFPEEPGRDAKTALERLKQRGVLARAVGAYGLPDCLRITIGKEADMRAVVEALAEMRA